MKTLTRAFLAVATAGLALLSAHAAGAPTDLDGNGRSDILWRNAATGENYAYLMDGKSIIAEGLLRTVFDLNWNIAGVGDFNGDGKSDILWRNFATGQNYVYLMNGTAIQGEGFALAVADLSWKVAGVGDFNGDGRDDILWRNAVSGENYVHLMNGTVLSGEGHIRAVTDLNWEVAGVGDFNGDGKADILWRNASSGENYLYPMNGLAILGTEGHIRTLANASWQVKAVADFNGDGKTDILWRHVSSGENYVYFMNGFSIAAEGYLRTVPDQNWQVAGIGDVNGDGRHDIVWRNATSGENYVYFMNSLSIAAEGYLRTVADVQWGIRGVGDYDGDGKSDILWRNAATGENYAYLMNGLSIANEGHLRTVAAPAWWQVVGLDDFNGDGRADVLWRNKVTGENYVYLMQGRAILGEGHLRTASLEWRVVGVGDFNGDAKADILWRNAVTGENFIQFLNGTIVASEGYIRSVPLGWSIAGIGDFNGDGKADILWRNTSSGEHYLYPMNGLAILGTEGYVRSAANPNWRVKGIADFNGDGTADILWRNISSGENYVYFMNGLVIVGEGYLRTVGDLAWQVAATGDYDGDGKADILWRHASTGENYVYPMDGTVIKPAEGYIRTVAELNWRPIRAVADIDAPSTPAGLTANAVSPSRIDLTWSAATDNDAVTGYRLYRNGALAATLTSTTYQNTGLTPATTYSYRVEAIDESGNVSGLSAPVTASTASVDTIAPTPPTGLTATAVSNSRINLSWVAATDNVGVTGYRIFRNGSLLDTVGNVTTYASTGLAASTTYTYAVRALDAAGNVSGLSSSASATTGAAPDTTPPTTPIGVAATVISSSRIGLNWSASTDNVAVTGYRVYRNGVLLVTLGNVTTYESAGLAASTAYTYNVDAIDAAGNASGMSTAASATTLVATTATLAWDAVAAPNLSGYRVYYGTSPGTYLQSPGQGLSVGNVTTHTVTGLSLGTRYYFGVTAVDTSNNESGYSNEVSKVIQ